jgi:hypothetical protein
MIIISNILKTLAIAFTPSPPAIGGPEAFRYGLKPVAIGACLQRLEASRVAAVTVDGRQVALSGLNLEQLPPRERGRMECAIRATYHQVMR